MEFGTPVRGLVRCRARGSWLFAALHRSHSPGESGDARPKEVFDLHIQEMLERGEVSSSVAKAFHIFADQIRLLNGQVGSMRKEWSDENQQTKDRVNRLATEVATQSDAGRMRMIVQRL